MSIPIKKTILCLVLVLFVVFIVLMFVKKDSNMNGKMSEVDVRLKSLELNQQKLINEGEFSQFKKQWENQLLALEERINKQSKTLSFLSEKIEEVNSRSKNWEVRFQEMESLLSLLESSQKKYEKQLEVLKEKLSGISEAKKTIRPVYKSTSDKPRQLSQSQVPFTFSGIEYRGGNAFAVVVPNNVTSLSQLQLIDIGEEVQGWKLIHMSGESAKFTSKGRSLILPAK
ncbi:hypothetical protein [Xenorhabdus griffiniae]|uniref:Uncharacterized protein n=1 Tax=Xenorhabdus griffiniae TaxID=351672 RepID=A0ABY9XEU5_9GAMM|nr:hypothetical protein [Xenorhabdus griffiniae]MBD1225983.1 hypothetical protein [Xenorhabdus griffiniae]MBE8585899.1 hypothetical protein [Xenorhabdus griffiniae]WMV71443.1 hypothetical protein QL128_14880 [Xenorhabdus griffiniae]WNH01120.1 hypothetical protein QL112_014885 [Xenorhabdus griffiniae]